MMMRLLLLLLLDSLNASFSSLNLSYLYLVEVVEPPHTQVSITFGHENFIRQVLLFVSHNLPVQYKQCVCLLNTNNAFACSIQTTHLPVEYKQHVCQTMHLSVKYKQCVCLLNINNAFTKQHIYLLNTNNAFAC